MANDILQRPALGGSLSDSFSEDTFFQSEATEQIHLMTCNDRPVVATIHVKDVRGIFMNLKEMRWSCYQRNKISLTCSYELPAWTAIAPIMLHIGNEAVEVQAIGLTVTLDPRRPPVQIVCKSVKRGRSQESQIGIIKVRPTYTASESDVDIDITRAASRASVDVEPAHSDQTIVQPSAQSHLAELPLEHTFERLHLSRATANNGKRRSTQEFFELILELHAQLGAEGEQSSWIKVAQCVSSSFVVRGRSPRVYNGGPAPVGEPEG